jgi:hypothetical protein
MLSLDPTQIARGESIRAMMRGPRRNVWYQTMSSIRQTRAAHLPYRRAWRGDSVALTPNGPPLQPEGPM